MPSTMVSSSAMLLCIGTLWPVTGVVGKEPPLRS